MRLKDLSGAHEWIGAEALMRSLMVWRLSARKISASWRLVMRRVFEGGVGCCRGGIEERSIDIGVLDPFDETGRDAGGELSELSVAILVVECCPWRLSRLMRGFLERIVTKVVLIRLGLRRQVGNCCGFIYLRSVVEVWLLATCVHSTASLKSQLCFQATQTTAWRT